MKKIIITTVCVIIAFITGVLTGYHGCESKYRLIKANANTIPYKIEVIAAQRAALDAADQVMEGHELFDTDGGNDMANYLHKAAIVDSLYNLENQGLCSSLSKQLRNKFFLHSREIVENTMNYRYCGHMTRAISRLIL